MNPTLAPKILGPGVMHFTMVVESCMLTTAIHTAYLLNIRKYMYILFLKIASFCGVGPGPRHS